ncbi:MAG: signal peptidase I [Chloroflexi bacterium]|nr:signal peptidase I [Chloroflexota bacterium]
MRSLLREVLQTTLLALVLFGGLQATVRNFRVEGSSMEPTLHEGQYLLVNRLVYFRLDLGRLGEFLPFWEAEDGKAVYPFRPPQEGDIIVFQFPQDPSRDFVKRVIGVPGDALEIRGGQVYVNGKQLAEPYVLEPVGSSYTLRVLGPGEYFVLGDNRRHSNDSRNWGTVSWELIIGKAWVVYWPPDRMALF